MTKFDTTLFRPVLWPIVTLLMVSILTLLLRFHLEYKISLTSGSDIPLYKFGDAALWLTVAWLMTSIVDVVVWENMVQKRIATRVPQLLKTIVNALIYLFAIICIVGYVFNQSISGLVATTGVVGLVLGFGLRSTIESAFNGVALSVDPIIQIGDSVLVDKVLDKPAKVIEITWRYTIFKDASGNLVVVPNTKICSAVVTNYSRPTPISRYSLVMTIYTPALFIHRIKRILEAALKATESILQEPSPNITIIDIADAGIKYQLGFSIDGKQGSAAKTKSELYQNIMHHFAVAGIGLEVTSIRYQDQALKMLSPSAVTEKVLKETSLFSELSAEHISALADAVRVHVVKEGEAVIRQGEAGDSMYIVAEGLFKVCINDPKHAEPITVAKLAPGSFFGEMSLLVGDPRSATIIAMSESLVYEISKTTMQKLFEAAPNLIQVLSNKIAQRTVTNLQKKQAILDKDTTADTQSYTDKFYKMINKWFWNKEEGNVSESEFACNKKK